MTTTYYKDHEIKFMMGSLISRWCPFIHVITIQDILSTWEWDLEILWLFSTFWVQVIRDVNDNDFPLTLKLDYMVFMYILRVT